MPLNLDSYQGRLGSILMFETTDARRVTFGNIKRVTAFTSVTAVLMQGSTDLTASYVTGSPTVLGGNSLRTALIGNGIVAGEYSYFITGTYDGGFVSTWAVDVLVQPRDSSNWFKRSQWKESYDPFIAEVPFYGSDQRALTVNIPLTDFTAVSSQLWSQGADVTSTYVSGSPSFSGNTLTTGTIGGALALVPGEYYCYLTGTYKDGNVATWYFKILALPRYGVQ